ncbi:inorganic diphosphatase [Segetibacter sp.]|jgi:inorganic pyrophosphatase|uniref:inorganic diphosphatase n=1 Tax=Segetibacter sp. TaxID=2231182 RepID=UPI0026043119|nr:inorganic diphosphatase [Segetibacter sp.]MCW3079092.1 Inorganic diphosphatase [Segetibacter sp.]
MRLPPPFIEGTNHINAIVETPKGSCNKYVYEEAHDIIKLKRALPAGMVFPFDFGFIPSTIAEDGDPMDVLVLTDAPTFPGCLVESKVLGIIKVEQEEDGERVRNDRVVAVQLQSRMYASANNIDDLPEGLVKEIVNFFASYNQVSEDVFNPLGNDGPDVAVKLIHTSIKKASQNNNS